jgi:hypothetical protein
LADQPQAEIGNSRNARRRAKGKAENGKRKAEIGSGELTKDEGGGMKDETKRGVRINIVLVNRARADSIEDNRCLSHLAGRFHVSAIPETSK